MSDRPRFYEWDDATRYMDSLEAEVEQLRQEVEQWRLASAVWTRDAEAFQAETAELRQQLEEARADKAHHFDAAQDWKRLHYEARQRGDALAEALRPLVHLLTYDQDPRNYSTQVLGSIEAASTALEAWGKDLVTKD